MAALPTLSSGGGTATSSAEAAAIAAQTGKNAGNQNYGFNMGTMQTGIPPVSNNPAVVSGKAAATDYQNKLGVFNNTLSNVSTQAANIQAKQQMDAQAKAQADAEAKTQQMEQQKIDIAKQQADAKTAAAASLATPAKDITAAGDKFIDTQGTPQTAKFSPETGQPFPTGTNGAPSYDPATINTSENNQYRNDITSVSDAQTQAYQSLQGQIQSIMSGTFPLNSTEQALLTSTQNSFNSLIQQQQVANKSYVGQVTEAQARSGAQEYTPELAAGNIQAAVSTGVAKISDLDAKAAQTLAQLQQGFQKDDFQMITAQYDALDKVLAEKSNAITALHQDVTSQESAIRDFNLKQQEDAIQQSQFAQDQALKIQSQKDQEEKNRFDEQIQGAQLALQQGEYNATYGIFQGAGNGSGGGGTQSVTQLPGMTNLSSSPGTYYLDTNKITNAKQKAAMTNFAAQAGIPIVDPADLPAVQKIDTALNRLDTMSQYVTQIAPGNVVGEKLLAKLGYATGDVLSALGTTAPQQAAREAYNSNKLEIFNIINSLSGSSPRINSQTLASAVQSLPDFGVLNTSNIVQANSKLNLMRTYLHDALQATIPGYVPPLLGQQFPSLDAAYSYAKQTGQDSQIQTIIKNNPSLGPDDILAVINGPTFSK